MQINISIGKSISTLGQVTYRIERLDVLFVYGFDGGCLTLKRLDGFRVQVSKHFNISKPIEHGVPIF